MFGKLLRLVVVICGHVLYLFYLVYNLRCSLSDNVLGFVVMQCVSKRVFADSRLHDIPMSISGHACRGWCTRNDISIFWMHNSFPKMCIAKSCIYPFLCLSKLQNLSVDLWVCGI